MTWIKPRLRFVAGGVFYKLKEIAGFSLKGSIYRTLKVINDQLKRNNKATTVFHWVVWLENYPAELLTGIIKNEKDILKPLMATQIPPLLVTSNSPTLSAVE